MATLVSNLGGTAGFGENALTTGSPSSGYIDLTSVFPKGLSYFGKTFVGMEVTQYGAVSLVEKASTDAAIIYAFYGRSDTSATPGAPSPGGTSTGSNMVYWDIDPVHHRVTITWDDVLPSDPSVKTGNAFQLTLADKSDESGTQGDFDIVLRYEAINWLNAADTYQSFAAIQTGYSNHSVSPTQQTGDLAFQLPDASRDALLNLPNASNIGVPGVFNYNIRNANPTTLYFSLNPVQSYGVVGNRDGSAQFSYFDVFEGTGAATPLQFTITRVGPRDAPLDVTWFIQPDTPFHFTVDASDFVDHAMSGVLHFDPGQKAAVLNLPIAGDSDLEYNEMIDITFSSDAIVESARIQVLVIDDEPVNLIGTEDGDMLIGSGGNDRLTGNGGSDDLRGGFGDDFINAGAGDDSLIGGYGVDTASYVDSIASVTVNLAVVGLHGQNTGGAGTDRYGDYFENLEGSRHDDRLIGNHLDNLITGLEGNDRLDGRGGTDTLVGGAGNDTYVVWESSDTVVEQPGEGTDRVLARVSAKLAANVERLDLVGTAPIDGTGSADANVIVGNGAANVLNGAGGADRLTGRGGADTFEFLANGGLVKPVVITDFATGTDRLLIEADALSALHSLAGQTLTDADLALGSKATADQHLIYYAKTGALYYDADGVGGQAQIKVAILLGHPDLHASDIGVIAF